MATGIDPTDEPAVVVIEKASPRIVGGPSRSQKVKLIYPVEYDGKIWTEIEVRRITTAELAAFIEASEDRVPPNVCAPKEVVDALDAEDGFAVEEATARFFPRRLPATMEPSTGPIPRTGEAL